MKHASNLARSGPFLRVHSQSAGVRVREPAGTAASSGRVLRQRIEVRPAPSAEHARSYRNLRQKIVPIIWPTMCRPKNPSQHRILTGESFTGAARSSPDGAPSQHSDFQIKSTQSQIGVGRTGIKPVSKKVLEFSHFVFWLREFKVRSAKLPSLRLPRCRPCMVDLVGLDPNRAHCGALYKTRSSGSTTSIRRKGNHLSGRLFANERVQ